MVVNVNNNDNNNENRSNNFIFVATYQDVLPAILPFYHIYGLTMILLRGLSYGCKLVTLPKLESDLFLNILKNYKV